MSGRSASGQSEQQRRSSAERKTCLLVQLGNTVLRQQALCLQLRKCQHMSHCYGHLAGVRNIHADIRIKPSTQQRSDKHEPAQDQGYGYVCQTFDCSDFYEVPGLSKSKAE